MPIKSEEFREAHSALRKISAGERLWLSMYAASETGVDGYCLCLAMLNALIVTAAQLEDTERFKVSERARDLADILERSVLEDA